MTPRPDNWREIRDRFRDQSPAAARKLAAELNAGAARDRRGREQASSALAKWLDAGCRHPMPSSADRARPSSRHFVERLEPPTRSGAGRQAQRTAARSRKPTPVAPRRVAPARASVPAARSRPASINSTAIYDALNQPLRSDRADGRLSLGRNEVESMLRRSQPARSFGALADLAYGMDERGASILAPSPRGGGAA